MPRSYVDQHLAEDLVIDKLVQILTDFLPENLDALYYRDPNAITGVADAGEDAVTPGVYLPDPSVYYRQTAPSTDDDKGIGDVLVYIGPIGGATPTGNAENARPADNGFVWQMEQVFAVSAVFGRAPQGTVFDPQTERELRAEEVLKKRASYYAGGIAHTVFSRAFGTAAIWGTKPGARSAQQTEIPLDGEEYVLIGVSAFEFTVVNNQLFPDHIRT